MKAWADKAVDAKTQTMYRSGVRKLIHMMKWSWPDVLNTVQDVMQQMSAAMMCHVKAMKWVMAYLMAMPKQGLTLKPSEKMGWQQRV